MAQAVSKAALQAAQAAATPVPKKRGRPPSISLNVSPLVKESSSKTAVEFVNLHEIEGSRSEVPDDNKESATPETVMDDKEDASMNGDVEEDDIDESLETGGTTDLRHVETLTRDEEIEKLRHGGSMSQSNHDTARVKNLNRIRIGQHEVETWYFAPYPKEFAGLDVVHICEFCLTPFGNDFQLRRHRFKCTLQHPPGNEIYRSGPDHFSFYELDGRKQRMYCRNLCLLSKLFLDHKTLYYDITPFMFYILCRNDHNGSHLIGYFSKEKESADNYNVACILTLPQYQRKGFGRLLIDFSYQLTKSEGKLGSPEKPLSDLGLLSYRAYWTEVIADYLINIHGETTIEDIAHATGIIPQDVLHTLQYIDGLKYYRGQHVIVLSDKIVEQYSKSRHKKKLRITPELLEWEPPKFAPSQLRFL